MIERRRDFTKLLVDKGLITQEQLEEAYNLHSEKGGSLSEILVSLGHIDDRDLMLFLSTHLSIPPIKVLNLKIPKDVLAIIPKELAKKYLVLPIGKIGKNLTLAVADPLNVLVFEDLANIVKCEITPVITSRSELSQALDIHYKESVTNAVEEIIKDTQADSLEIIKEVGQDIKDDELLRSIDEAPVIKLANYILRRSVEDGASDVFVEPLSDYSRIRFRIDGILKEVQTIPKNMHNAVISRIKVIANLNITEHRLPQDGRFCMNILKKNIDFRVSVLPTTAGEKIVLRVLDQSRSQLDLALLGYEDNVVQAIKKDSLSPYGMILVCGPTGSGKTTTLYSTLKHIYSPEKNIITVEEPIEYQLPGINQVNVNYEVDLTFSSALRSILRQDPDVIMVGEIRDFDTVDIAIKAALTGHLVLSTLHTTTAAGSITRLVNMGVEPFLLSSTLIGVLAQRLVRKLCPKCKRVREVTPELVEKYKIPQDVIIYKPKGCRRCNNQGYAGRIAVAEYLCADSDIRRLINESVSEHLVKRAARKKGMVTLREDALKKFAQGLTSLEEVLRVTAADEDDL